VLSSCISSYQQAQEYFYRGNQSYLNNHYEHTLWQYCHSLRQFDMQDPTSPFVRSFKAKVYYRFYLMDANRTYQESGDETKVKCSDFANVLDTTDKADFLKLAFSEIKEVKGTDLKTVNDDFLIIYRDLIVADWFLNQAEKVSTDIQVERIPSDFIKDINSFAYYEIAKSSYLSGLQSLMSARQFLSDNEKLEVGTLRKTASNGLKNIYYLLFSLTAKLDTIEFKRLNEHYSKAKDKIEENISEHPRDDFYRNSIVFDSEFHINEARSRMDSAIEMFITDKIDKAEGLLLQALINTIYAKEFPTNISQKDKNLIDIIQTDIYSNLYRLYSQSMQYRKDER
jgi:hypothetical protein